MLGAWDKNAYLVKNTVFIESRVTPVKSAGSDMMSFAPASATETKAAVFCVLRRGFPSNGNCFIDDAKSAPVS